MRLQLRDGLIPVVAFLAILPLLLQGPSCGHDFDFHLLSWLEAATQLAHGGYPHWAYTPAYNAGEPRFLFYSSAVVAAGRPAWDGIALDAGGDGVYLGRADSLRLCGAPLCAGVCRRKRCDLGGCAIPRQPVHAVYRV